VLLHRLASHHNPPLTSASQVSGILVLCHHAQPSYFSFFLSLVVAPKAQSLVLARQVLYHLNCTVSPFCFTYFTNRVPHLFLSQPGPRSSYLCFLPSWADVPVLPCPAIGWYGVSLGWYGVSWTFFPRLPFFSLVLPIASFWAARIIGKSHCTWPSCFLK
jgi:hypothetical protein